MMKIERSRVLGELKRLVLTYPVTAILGPRQCGKTTLAKMLNADYYFDLENPRDEARLQDAQLTLEDCQGLIVIDEVQRKPDLFNLLRYLVDNSKKQRFVLLGSATPHLVKGVSESLAGRIAFLNLGGFSLSEVGSRHLKKHWIYGGYPAAYLAKSELNSIEWLQNYITTFLERDVPMLGFSIPASTLRRFWIMLSHYHGQIFNASEIGKSLGISDATAKRYLDLLEGTMLISVLHPWFSNTSKRMVKRPKIYLRDSGLFHALQSIQSLDDLLNHPKLGASWEGYAMEEVCRSINKTPQNRWFWSTHSGAELDLYWQEKGRNWGVEFKYSGTPTITKSMQIACEDLGLSHLWVIYPGREQYKLSSKITALPLTDVKEVWDYKK